MRTDLTPPADDSRAEWPLRIFICAQVLLLAGSLFWSRQCFIHASYFILLLLFVATLHAGLYFRGAALNAVRKHLPGFIGAALLAILVAVSVKPMLRVTSDENSLISTSHALAFDKKADMPLEAAWINGVFTPIIRDYDKRPLTFPFLTSLLHASSGARYENGFAVNWLMLFMLLIAVYWLSRQYLGVAPSLAMQLLVLAHPVVSQAATSAGMDLTAAAFLLLSLAGLKAFLNAPSAARLQLFWFASLYYFNSRYESPLFVFLMVCGLAAGVKDLPWRRFRFNWLWLTPLFLMPQLWQRLSYALRSDAVTFDKTGFSLASVAANLKPAWAILTRPDHYYPYASELVVLGLAGFVVFIVRRFKDAETLNTQEKVFRATCLAVIGGFTLLMLSANGSPVDSPAISRYYLLPCAALSLLAGNLLLGVLRKFNASAFLLPIGAAVFLFHHPATIQNNFLNAYPNPREFANTLRFLETREPRRFLLVAAWAPHYVALRYGSVNYEYARANSEWLRGRLESREIPEVLVLQDIDALTGTPTPGTSLDAKVRLEKLHEFPNVPAYFSRISRVVSF